MKQSEASKPFPVNKTALITGTAQRIGKTIALELAVSGYNIALHYNRSREKALELCEKIKKIGRRCEIFQADLFHRGEMEKLVPQVFQTFPDLALLINNASVFERASLVETEYDLFERQMNLNFRAPFFLSRDFARLCRHGHIVNILDTKIAHNRNLYFSYTLSKKILGEFTKMAALELAPDIRVNGIAPGLILPPADKDNDYLDKLAERIPLRSKGNPDLIIRTLLFLLENEYITGQIIFVDGGDHL